MTSLQRRFQVLTLTVTFGLLLGHWAIAAGALPAPNGLLTVGVSQPFSPNPAEIGQPVSAGFRLHYSPKNNLHQELQKLGVESQTLTIQFRGGAGSITSVELIGFTPIPGSKEMRPFPITFKDLAPGVPQGMPKYHLTATLNTAQDQLIIQGTKGSPVILCVEPTGTFGTPGAKSIFLHAQVTPQTAQVAMIGEAIALGQAQPAPDVEKIENLAVANGKLNFSSTLQDKLLYLNGTTPSGDSTYYTPATVAITKAGPKFGYRFVAYKEGFLTLATDNSGGTLTLKPTSLNIGYGLKMMATFQVNNGKPDAPDNQYYWVQYRKIDALTIDTNGKTKDLPDKSKPWGLDITAKKSGMPGYYFNQDLIGSHPIRDFPNVPVEIGLKDPQVDQQNKTITWTLDKSPEMAITAFEKDIAAKYPGLTVAQVAIFQTYLVKTPAAGKAVEPVGYIQWGYTFSANKDKLDVSQRAATWNQGIDKNVWGK